MAAPYPGGAENATSRSKLEEDKLQLLRDRIQKLDDHISGVRFLSHDDVVELKAYLKRILNTLHDGG